VVETARAHPLLRRDPRAWSFPVGLLRGADREVLALDRRNGYVRVRGPMRQDLGGALIRRGKEGWVRWRQLDVHYPGPASSAPVDGLTDALGQ